MGSFVAEATTLKQLYLYPRTKKFFYVTELVAYYELFNYKILEIPVKTFREINEESGNKSSVNFFVTPIEIIINLSKILALCKVFYIIPKIIRDIIYDWIAKNRYSIFGKVESCSIIKSKVNSEILKKKIIADLWLMHNILLWRNPKSSLKGCNKMTSSTIS